MSVQQRASRYTSMVEANVTVVGLIVRVFEANVTNFETREWFVVLQRADLHNEWMYTIILIGDDKPGHDYAMSGRVREGARPELGRRQ